MRDGPPELAGAVRRRWPGWAWRCGCGPGRQIEAEAGRSGTQQKRGQRSGLNRASAAALVSEEQKQQHRRPAMRAWGRVHSGEGLGAGRRSLTDPATGHRFPATARRTGARGGIHGSRRTLGLVVDGNAAGREDGRGALLARWCSDGGGGGRVLDAGSWGRGRAQEGERGSGRALVVLPART